jgi:hypothetical protein
MTSASDVLTILRSDPSPDKRILNFGALLAKEIDSEVIIVGGSAIEVLTKGQYVSGDIDIRADRSRVAEALKRWGFENPSRLWIHDGWRIAVDVVGDRYSGDPYRATVVVTPFGPVSLAVPEDLIVKRLARAKHWGGSDQDKREDLVQARLLWEGYRSTLDLAYLEDRARHYGVEDLLDRLRGR